MPKRFLLFILAVSLFFIVNVFSVSAESDSCAQIFTSNCAECHGLERGCNLLGQSPEEWEELFEFMENMGADIDQQTTLVDCLSKPDDDVKAACKK